MSWGRALSAVASVVAVAGAAVVAVGMSRSGAQPGQDSDTPFVMPTTTHTTYTAPAPPVTTAAHRSTPSAVATKATAGPVARRATTAVAPVPRRAGTSATATAPPPSPTPRTTTRAAAPPAPPPPAAPAPVRGQRLPLSYSTGTATRVITVVAGSSGSTTAALQAWDKAPGGGWLRHGSAVTAHVGSQGMSSTPSESRSATPMGSFTLTQAFGYYGNPGTGLRYFTTTSADWWISESGPLYNTHQRCSSGCGFSLGDPNERLRFITPQYNYAVVIDYNTRNSPTGVRQGAGSAFFLHVSDGSATAGCISIPQSTLVSIMRWLTPTAHPRILIGVT